MSAEFSKSCAQAARFCARCAVTLAIWTIWLALLVTLSAQIYVASANRLPVPGFLLRAIESRLAVSGVTVTFGSATFDPAGRILVENARMKLASFNEPVATARALYVWIDPVALLTGRFEPIEIRGTGVDFLVPAMLSASGRAEKIVEDLDAGLTPKGDELRIDYLSCRLGPMAVSALGALHTGRLDRSATALPTAEFLARHYPELIKEFARAVAQMSVLDEPRLRAVLTPSETRGAIISATLFAQALNLGPKGIQATRLRAASRFPLLGGAPTMTAIDAWFEEIRGPDKIEAKDVRAHLRGSLDLDAMSFSPKEAEISAADAEGAGVQAAFPFMRLTVASGSLVHAEAAGLVSGSRIAAEGEANWTAGTANVRFDARVAPGILDVISAKTGRDVRRFVDFSEPIAAAGEARFAKGWRLAGFSARVSARGIVGYHVKFDEVRGLIEYDGHRLAAPEVYGRVGDNFAVGSYEQQVPSNDYRFLLEGRLRPLDITGWFHDWWPKFFGNFAFPDAPPAANVDVRGRWGRDTGRFSSEFVFADSGAVVIRGSAFDRVHTRLFIRPNFCDGLECVVFKGSGSAQGTFTHRSDPELESSGGFDFAATSSLAPADVKQLLGSGLDDLLARFSFLGRPPTVALTGRFVAAVAQEPRHSEVHAEVRSPDPLRFHGVLFDRANFIVDWRDDEFTVDPIDAGFAGGSLAGKVTVTGKDANRRVSFSAALDDASLGRAIASAGTFAAPEIGGDKTASLGAFARDKSGVRLDLSATADGVYGDSRSYVGSGAAQLQGGELGGLSLLGGLSKLLSVTELRFTTARSSFKINRSKLEFDDVTVTGANSAIRARGTYGLDRRQLDFNAKIYPFQESKSVLKLLGVLSLPVSSALEVRLTGTVEKPAWNFAYGPLNLLRIPPSDRPPPPSPLAQPPE